MGSYKPWYFRPPLSFLRDSSQVLQVLETLELKDSYIVATADMSSLYTIISHSSLDAVESFLTRDNQLAS